VKTASKSTFKLVPTLSVTESSDLLLSGRSKSDTQTRTFSPSVGLRLATID